MYIKLNQSQWLDLLAELRNLLLFFSHLSFRVLKFANNVLQWCNLALARLPVTGDNFVGQVKILKFRTLLVRTDGQKSSGNFY